jgi:predicted  nucleic acid-binding Zn-ribbon protein
MVTLSQIDKELESYEPLIAKINEKVNEIEVKLNDLASQKEDITKEIESAKTNITVFEKQIEEESARLNDIKKKSASAKNEKEIFALSQEEHIAKDKIDFAGEEIERFGKIITTKEALLADLDSEISTLQEQLNSVKEEADKELEEINAKKIATLEKRDEQARSMEQKILSLYEKIVKWAGNSAVVKVENQACYGCFMKINDKAYSDLIIGEEIVTCPHCGRVLYLETEAQEA